MRRFISGKITYLLDEFEMTFRLINLHVQILQYHANLFIYLPKYLHKG